MDAISAIWDIGHDAYTEFYIYQVEWVLGESGYVRWMLEDAPTAYTSTTSVVITIEFASLQAFREKLYLMCAFQGCDGRAPSPSSFTSPPSLPFFAVQGGFLNGPFAMPASH
ncbi:hypothetical protein H310_14645 [Aphanomyces invadans]|uniref:Uncharacterized protein n=1 Tax=Aphanomyces invadans TaxID=157072 RepID=A0A024T9C9_9STRA|nr:hypothetical protein H310_14645 [Aphanomyces invadans]ETV90609.1 hypothetical protein H310_14645 [Aphanomyces invadans]|eukprot:XP_008880762.1 hypothetical protein H310_14645 [Aphanomyces invadans]